MITLGIYYVVWYYKINRELRDFGRSYGMPNQIEVEKIEFYPSREEAEQALQDVLTDEPKWEGELGVVTVELPASAQ